MSTVDQSMKGTATTPTTRDVLPNGLTVLITEEHSSPVVAINVWVRAGYFDEEDSEVGISHVIEHMFFKGTPDRPRPDQIATEIKSLGGELNAATYYDSTNYYVVLPSVNFRKGLEIQADALMHPLFESGELKREIDAVLQEARRKIDTPGAYAVEMLYRESFDVHRIRRWRIGAEERIRSLSRDDLLVFYEKHYIPGRVILSIVGDVETARALEAAHVFLGGMAAVEGSSSFSLPEPAQRRFKYRRLTGDIKRGYTLLGYHAAPALSDDDVALRILAHVLGGGRSSRLQQALKERLGLVDVIGTSLQSFADVGVLAVIVENDPKNARATAGAIQAEIARLRREPPEDAEIERARTAIEFRYHQNRSEVLGRSSILAYYEAMGGYLLAEEMVKRLARVEPADVHRVAEGYLDLSKATLLEYHPEEAGIDSPDTSVLLDELQHVSPSESIPEVVAPRASIEMVPDAVSLDRVDRLEAAGQVGRHSFESGPLLLHEEDGRLPLVTFSVAFRGGRSAETRENSGISRLMQSTMIKGSPRRDARRTAAEIDSLGTVINKMLDEDYVGFSMSVLSKHARRGFEILMDLVRNPAFLYEEIEKERVLQLSAQQSIKDQSLAYTFQLFRRAAFGSHPYALPTFGLEAPVRSVKRDALLNWHRMTIRPSTMVVSAVGDIGEEKVLELVGSAISGWGQDGQAGKDPGQVLAWGTVEVIETRRRKQTAQVIGFPTPGLLSPERFALDLVQVITSGLGGRFFEEVRGKRGLAYAVHAFNYSRVSGGAFTVYMATSPGHEEEARKVLFQEVARLRHDGPRRDEVDRAIRYLRGAHAIAMQTSAARSLRYVDAEVRGLGTEEVLEYPEKVAGVGYEEVRDCIWRYLDLNHCTMGILRGEKDGS